MKKKKLKIYLDSSCLNRIFDDQTQPRIYLESAAMTVIFNYIDNKMFDLVSSEVLDFESEKNPFNERRLFVDSLLGKAKYFQSVDNVILNRAKEIELTGIKSIDSLHISCAEAQNVDFLITCDDAIIKKYKGTIKIENPINFNLTLQEK
jgi:predicted nucleic acid-binding protein